MRGHPIGWTEAELAFIRRHRRLPRRELFARFQAQFGRADVSPKALAALCKRKGWLTGRSGRWTTGTAPSNKGQRMPWNANSAATRFKPGVRLGVAAARYKPIGAERIDRSGYLERKVNDDRPFRARWRAVHLLRWEEANGPVPQGHCLKSLDGDKLNTDPANWVAIPRAMLPRLAGRSGRAYDQAPAELKPTLLLIARLEQRVAEVTAP